MTRSLSGRLAPWVVGLALAAGCGEKITLPEADGIPVVSDYFDITPSALAEELDWVSDVEGFGGVFAVSDSAGGKVVLLFDDGKINPNRGPITGLTAPIALEFDFDRTLLLVVQDLGGSFEVVTFDSRLEEQEVLALGPEVQAVSDIATDGDFLYVGDPIARTVHRFALTPAPGFGPLTRQGTMVAPDPSVFDQFSPQVVRRPGGMTTDEDGMILVCDADTTRNWVLRYDPLAPEGDPEGRGTSVIFGPTREELAAGPAAFDPSRRCGDVFSIEASTLGLAPSCSPPPDFAADPSSADGEFHTPSGVAIDGEGFIYVADRFNGRIQRFTPEGDFESDFGPGLATGDEELREPVRVAAWDGFTITPAGRVNIAGARIFVVDASNGRLRVYEDSRWTPFRDQN